ncbi:TPA: hypothetical protein N0F65_002132 [Lagenidium giganteum]|uniref:RING-type domain-containing protein n=1 Tax=Lagenidium giganteum TaxID=4803 RepID=A0AAV2ZKQ1_9STRA|nr:TPA: hypothetical protein N0F65_002132 [Lagenidium giganteum]
MGTRNPSASGGDGGGDGGGDTTNSSSGHKHINVCLAGMEAQPQPRQRSEPATSEEEDARFADIKRELELALEDCELEPTPLHDTLAASSTTMSSQRTRGECRCGQSVRSARTAEFLIECHFCMHWYHGKCLGVTEQDAVDIVKFSCDVCSKHGNMTQRQRPGADDSVDGGVTIAPLMRQMTAQNPTLYHKNSDAFRRVLRTARFAKSAVQQVPLQEFSASFFHSHPFDKPLLIPDHNWSIAGMSNRYPAIDVNVMASTVHNEASAAVFIHTNSQEVHSLQPQLWSMCIANTMTTPLLTAFRVDGSPAHGHVNVPFAVSTIDWHFLITSNVHSQHPPPGPEVLGLMAGEGAFLDFTRSPGGQATWLAVAHGSMNAFLIAPTDNHVQAFHSWRTSVDPPSSAVFLADQVSACHRCVLPAGSTLCVPPGWMYALSAAQESSCYVGFFSSALTLERQLLVLEAEASMSTPAAPPPPPTPFETLLQAGRQADVTTQIWVAIEIYFSKLRTHESQSALSLHEREALRRALPLLARWASSGRAGVGCTGPTWRPQSVQEAHDVLTQLHAALTDSPHRPVAHYDDHSSPNNQAMPQPAYHHHHAPHHSATWPPNVHGDHQNNLMTPTMVDFGTMWESHGAVHPAPGATTFFAPGPRTHPHPQLREHVAPVPNNGGQAYPSSTQPAHAHENEFMSFGSQAALADMLVRHRASCHRCGNLRKKSVRCPTCPHIFCQKCAEKMLDEHGNEIFVDGCPVCKEKCCCGKNRSTECVRKFHCYKKCPATKRTS